MADYDPTLARARELYLSLYSSEHPQSWLAASLCEATGATSPLDRWRPEHVRDAIALLTEALNLLGDRSGVRASSTRAALTAQRDTLQSALDLYESLGANLDQPKALEFIAQIARVRAAKKESELAVEMATPDAVIDCIADLERAKAVGRALCRELVDLGRALKVSSKMPLPDRAAFDAARASSETLAGLPARKPKASHLQLALTAGEADPKEALFWPCFEGAPHVLFDLRAEHFDARGH